MTPDATPLLDFMMTRQDCSRSVRAALVARAVLEEASIPLSALMKSCLFVADVVSEYAEKISVGSDGGRQPEAWVIELKPSAEIDEEHEELDSFFDLSEILLVGSSGKRGMQLADCLAKKSAELCRMLSVLLIDGGGVCREGETLKFTNAISSGSMANSTGVRARSDSSEPCVPWD